MLEEREAFLRAIFDAPDDDLPRLVYADWLEEQGTEIAARAIRLSIACVRANGDAERAEHLDQFQRLKWENPDLLSPHDVLFRNVLQSGWDGAWYSAELTAGELTELDSFRAIAVERPRLFAIRHLILRTGTGRINDPRPFDTIYNSVALRNVVALDLAGEETAVVENTVTDEGGGHIERPTYDTQLSPTVSLAGLESLAMHRLCKRLTDLDLTNNNLGNDALRALARSPYLDNLKRLDIAEGNNFRGRVWQQLIERFGEGVVN